MCIQQPFPIAKCCMHTPLFSYKTPCRVMIPSLRSCSIGHVIGIVCTVFYMPYSIYHVCYICHMLYAFVCTIYCIHVVLCMLCTRLYVVCASCCQPCYVLWYMLCLIYCRLCCLLQTRLYVIEHV